MAYRIVNNVVYIGAGETATYDVKVYDRSTGAPYILPIDNGGNAILSFVVKPSVYSRSAEPVIKKYIWLGSVELDTNVVYDYLEDEWDNNYGFGGGTQPQIRAAYRKEVEEGVYEYRYYDEHAEDDGTTYYKWKPYAKAPDGIEHNNYLRMDSSVIYPYGEEEWDNGYGFKGETQPRGRVVYKKLLSDGSGYEYRYYDATAEDDGTDDYMWKPYEFRITFPFYHEDTINLAPKQYKYELTLYGGPTLTIQGEEKKSLQNFNYKEILLSPTDFIVEGTLSE